MIDTSTLVGQTLLDYYHAIGRDPHECSMYGCSQPALFFVQGWSCNGGGWADRIPLVPGTPDCGHAHMIPASMCEEHTKKQVAAGLAIIGTTGD